MNAMDEKRVAFNEQMNEWVSRQGLWFQLRHAADGQTIRARMARVGLRLFIALILFLLVFWIYLEKRVESKDFKDVIQASVEKSLKGTDCKLGKIRKERDFVSITSLEIKGTDDSFFHSLKAHRMRFKMELSDGLIGKWEAGGVSVNKLDLLVKAGDSDNAGAAASYSALFDQHGGFTYDWIEVDSTDIRWGYSKNNRGSISGSHLTAAREGDSWRLEFKGGKFSQNWLKNLDIGKLVVICDNEGVHIKEGALHSGAGEIVFTLNIGSGGQPQAAGTVTVKSMPMKTLLPTRYHDWIEGTVSGKGTITGSTNSQEGIVMDLNLTLGDGDVMVLRDTLPLLSALSVVDLYNSYRKISFTEGECHIRTGGDLLKVDQINLQAGDLLHLTGDVDVRSPSPAEIARALDIEDVQVVRDVIENHWKMDDELLDYSDGAASLADAAKGVGDVVAGKNVAQTRTIEDVRELSILAEKNVRHFEGLMKVGLKRDAFDKAPKLKEEYPFDDVTGRIWVEAALAGKLQTLTLEVAEKLYVLGRNRK